MYLEYFSQLSQSSLQKHPIFSWFSIFHSIAESQKLWVEIWAYLNHWVSLYEDVVFKLLEFGWGTKVYVQNQSGPSNDILHRFCLTRGSTLTSQDYNPSSVVYVSKPIRAIWQYLISEFCALLCCSLSQWWEFKPGAGRASLYRHPWNRLRVWKITRDAHLMRKWRAPFFLLSFLCLRFVHNHGIFSGSGRIFTLPFLEQLKIKPGIIR